MMILSKQIISFVFSFLYGGVFYICYKKIYYYLYYVKEIYKILNSIFFEMIFTIIYFKMMLIINGGIINLYFILSFLFGYFIFCKIFTKKM